MHHPHDKPADSSSNSTLMPTSRSAPGLERVAGAGRLLPGLDAGRQQGVVGQRHRPEQHQQTMTYDIELALVSISEDEPRILRYDPSQT
jgi:hypothetical protein